MLRGSSSKLGGEHAPALHAVLEIKIDSCDSHARTPTVAADSIGAQGQTAQHTTGTVFGLDLAWMLSDYCNKASERLGQPAELAQMADVPTAGAEDCPYAPADARETPGEVYITLVPLQGYKHYASLLEVRRALGATFDSVGQGQPADSQAVSQACAVCDLCSACPSIIPERCQGKEKDEHFQLSGKGKAKGEGAGKDETAKP